MKNITQEELNKVLELHRKWLDDDPDGVCADLSNVDLRGLDLIGVNLRFANLSGADLRGANLGYTDLRGANLSGADLSNTNLKGVNLSNANLNYACLIDADLNSAKLIKSDLKHAILYGASLIYADLTKSNLRNSDIRYTNLNHAYLRGTNLYNVRFNENTSFFALQCPEEGSFIGYKKADGKIVVLQITEDAKRSSATTRKCRCSKAKVIRIEDLNGNILDIEYVKSDYDKRFIYKIGDIVEIKDFDDDRWNECSTGIHFFVTKKEAVRYDG